MALVRDIKLMPRSTEQALHPEADCAAFLFSDARGERYLQVEIRIGPAGARMGHVLQLDRTAASRLSRLIAKAFPGVAV